jgi:hypothetical protein
MRCNAGTLRTLRQLHKRQHHDSTNPATNLSPVTTPTSTSLAPTLLLIPAHPAGSVLLLLLSSHDRLQRLVVTRHFTAQLLVASQQRSDSSLVVRLQLRRLFSDGARLQTFNQDRQSTRA